MMRDSETSKKIKWLLYEVDVENMSDEYVVLYPELTEEERKIFHKKFLDDIEEQLFMNIEDQMIFEGFLQENRDLLKRLTNENKLFLFSRDDNVIELLKQNVEEDSEIKAIFSKHNFDPDNLPGTSELPDEFILDCMDYAFYSDNADAYWEGIAYLTCSCLELEPGTPAGEKYALYIMEAALR